MNTDLRNSLLRELDAIERELNDPTLTDSERQRLDQVWEDINDRLDDLNGLFIAIPAVDDLAWHGTPPPPSPVRIAPSPPPLSATHLHGLRPGEWSRPPPLEIPNFDDRDTEAPPPPRGWESDDEEDAYDSAEIEEWNQIVDDRPGCEHCPGCHYCLDGYGYDGADEI